MISVTSTSTLEHSKNTCGRDFMGTEEKARHKRLLRRERNRQEKREMEIGTD